MAMELYQKYEELRIFLGGRLWQEELRPMLELWAKRKREAMGKAATPSDLWDARTASNAAEEVLPMIDNALNELMRQKDAEEARQNRPVL